MYQKVLVPLDGSEVAECVLPHVDAIAQGCRAKNVTFIYVAKPLDISMWTSQEGLPWVNQEDLNRYDLEAKAVGEQYLSKILDQIKYKGVDVQPQVILGEPAADVITDYATKNGADLIIMSTHGRSGISRWVWGSVSDHILRAACIPILMVRAPGCVPGI
ncbi:universal stress protein [Chloroflexota bacterium]